MESGAIKILLVEDSEADVRLIEEMLSEVKGFDYELQNVSYLNQALEKLSDENFSIVLLDLSLPDSLGLETFRRVYAKVPDVPIVVLTVLSDEELGMETVREGAQDYLVKPDVTKAFLMHAIRYALERHRLKLANDELVSIIVHELRTPLSIIRESLAQILEGLHGPVADNQKGYLKMAVDNVDRLNHLVGNLLNVAKIEMGKLELQKVPFDMIDLADKVSDEFLVALQDKGLQLKKKFSQPEIVVYADKEKIIQIFTNVLGNAMKFTETGAIELEIAEKGDYVECCISDTGIGILEEDLPKIFSKFSQFVRKQKAAVQSKGSGLGLFITKALVESHGGTISVTSKVGKGTKVTFVLPKTTK
ncbi:MAG: ATP-binding protein [Candidatus Omnitrophota bacterium]